MTIYNQLVSLIGEVPSGLEPVVYICACVICVFFVDFLCDFIASFFYRRRR